MKNLLAPTELADVKSRVQQLRADSPRLWGTMTVAQTVAHCSTGLEIALGDRLPPRMLIGRILGPLVKARVLRDDEPLRRNSPTMPELVVADERDLDPERQRLLALLERFSAGGPEGCTSHAHSFFGRLTPTEWGVLMYKHLDHHLRQFGA